MVVTVNNIQWAKNGIPLIDCTQNIDVMSTVQGRIEWLLDVTLSNQSNDNCVSLYWEHNGTGYNATLCLESLPAGNYPDIWIIVADAEYQIGNYTNLSATPCQGLVACNNVR